MSLDLYVALQLLLLCLFVGGTSALLLAAVIGRMRVRRVLLSWQAGRFGGWPLGATLFVVGALGFTAWAGVRGDMLQAVIGSGYLAGGAFWWGSAFLARTVLASAYGIVRHAGRQTEVLAWSQVTDYFVQGEGKTCRYVFFYRKEGRRQRFTLDVPAGCREAFQQVIAEYVDARFEFEMRRAYGEEIPEE